MKAKKNHPILVHIIVCVCWNVLNYLFFIGPEPGILTQYVYNFINQRLAIIMMAVVVVVGLSITFGVYFRLGKQIQERGPNDKVVSILSIIFFDLLILLAIFIFTKNIKATIYYSQFTLNAPFFVLISQLRLSAIWSLVIFLTLPSVMMFLGHLYQKTRGRFS